MILKQATMEFHCLESLSTLFMRLLRNEKLDHDDDDGKECVDEVWR